MESVHRARIAMVGVGNPLVGDDGAGAEVIRSLEARWASDRRVLLCTLEGDLLGIADRLEEAERFLFVDAVAGSEPGEIVRDPAVPRAYAPSFHQTDVGTVMRHLEALGVADPFPPWEIWGIVIAPPRELRQALTPAVAEAVDRLSELLSRRIETELSRVRDGRGTDRTD